MTRIIYFLLAFSVVNASLGQTITSIQDGPWNNTATWSGGTIPDAGNSDEIIIATNVTIPSGYSVTIDGTTVSSGVSLTVAGGGTLTVATGDGSLIVQGTLVGSASSSIAGTDGTNVVFETGSVYTHAFTNAQGSIPLATWDATSTLNISGFTTSITASAAGNWSQDFGIVIWNCTAQTGTFNMQGLLTSIAGNFEIESTGTGILQLSTNQNPTVSIGGNFEVAGTSRVNPSTTGTAPGAVYDIANDFIYTSTNATGMRMATTGVCTFNIAGDFSMNAPAGILNLSQGTNGSGVLNISGDFDLTAGTIYETGGSASAGYINFIGTDANHNFTNTGTISNLINYSIPATNTVRTVGESKISGNANSTLTVDGTLVVESTHVNGAIQNGSGATGDGNIRVVTRTYNMDSRIVYGGTSAQFIGSGHPTVTTVDVEISNAAGVSLNNTTGGTVTFGKDLYVTNGNLNVANDNLIVTGAAYLEGGDIVLTTAASVRSVTFNGLLALDGGEVLVNSGTANANLNVNGDVSGANVVTFTGANSNLFFGGTGDVTLPISDQNTVELVSVSRTGTVTLINELTTLDLTINTGAVDMEATLNVTDDLNLATGTTLFFEGQTLNLSSQFNNTLSGGFLSSDAASTLNVIGTGTLGTLAFSPTGNVLGTLVLNRVTGGTLITLASTLTINDNLTLTDGTFANTSGLTFANGALLTRNSAASLTGAVPAGGPYDVLLLGGSFSTTAEVTGLINDLTSSSTGTVTLASPMTVTGDATIDATGIFDCSTQTATFNNLTINGTFNAPSADLAIQGAFVNNGTFNRNTSANILFDGTNTFSGTSIDATIFANVVITTNGSVTAPAIMTVSGNWTNNGVFDAGTGSVTFLGTTGTKSILGSSTTTFYNLALNNGGASPDLENSGSASLAGVLSLQANVVFDANGTSDAGLLTILSSDDDPTIDGAVGILPAGAQVTGNVTVQRYMSIEGPNGGRIYRYISSPVQGATVADLQDEIPVTGSFTGTSTCTGCLTNQSLFSYNESEIGDTNGDLVNTFDDGYVDFPAASNAEVFLQGVGYALFVRGNLLGSALWDLTGTVTSGAVNYGVTFTSSGVVANDGWNLVGNPYPSTIDWNAASGWTKTNLDGTIYMRDNANGGQYATWNGVTGTNGGSRYIPTGQAFWVKASAAAPAMTSNENVKAPGTQTTFFREQALTNLLRIAMLSDGIRDETVIHFREDAQSSYDGLTDALKLTNSTFNLFSLSADDVKLAINSLKGDSMCDDLIELGVEGARPGSYTLSFSGIESFRSSTEVILIDNFTSKQVPVTESSQYVFSITADPASSGSGRFRISFEASIPRLDLAVIAPEEVCQVSTAKIQLSSSEAGVDYNFYANGLVVAKGVAGTGGSLEIALNSQLLNKGQNEISVVASNGCESFAIGQPAVVELREHLAAASVEDGSACGPGQVTLKAGGASTGSTYQWFESEDAVEPLAQNETGLFNTGALSKTRSYYVAISDGSCVSPRKEVTAHIEYLEPVVVSEVEAGKLQSSYTEGNQWYLNDILIEGATSSVLIPEQSGDYSVKVTQGSCFTTDAMNYVITGLEEMAGLRIRIYPNPVPEMLTVDAPVESEVRDVTIFNSFGARLGSVKLNGQSGRIHGEYDMRPVASGIYYVRVISAGGIGVVKIIKEE
jgi:hypothetical protein